MKSCAFESLHLGFESQLNNSNMTGLAVTMKLILTLITLTCHQGDLLLLCCRYRSFTDIFKLFLIISVEVFACSIPSSHMWHPSEFSLFPVHVKVPLTMLLWTLSSKKASSMFWHLPNIHLP